MTVALYDPVYGYPQQPVIQMPQPYVPTPQPAQQMNQAPFVKVVTISGETEAKSLNLAPGSTLLASDKEESVIWFIKANDVGPNTVYKIPFDPAIFSGGTSTNTVEFSAIEKRIAEIEERMKKYESNAVNDRQSGNNSGNANNRR